MTRTHYESTNVKEQRVKKRLNRTRIFVLGLLVLAFFTVSSQFNMGSNAAPLFNATSGSTNLLLSDGVVTAAADSLEIVKNQAPLKSSKQQEKYLHLMQMISPLEASATQKTWLRSLASAVSLPGASGVTLVSGDPSGPIPVSAADQTTANESRFDITLAGAEAVGKVIFRRSDNSIGWCTGSIFKEKNVVLTAGHCLLGRDGSWNEKVVFVADYGAASQKVISASCLVVPAALGKPGKNRYVSDIGLIRLAAPAGVTPIKLTSLRDHATAIKIGYSDSIDDGQSKVLLESSVNLSGSDEYRSFGDSLGEGSSGSPWFSRDGGLFSLSSRFYNDKPSEMIGPNLNETLYAAADELQKCSS